MIYKMQYTGKKDNTGATINQLTVGGVVVNPDLTGYKDIVDYCVLSMSDNDTYQEARPNGDIYHQSTGKDIKKSTSENPYWL